MCEKHNREESGRIEISFGFGGLCWEVAKERERERRLSESTLSHFGYEKRSLLGYIRQRWNTYEMS